MERSGAWLLPGVLVGVGAGIAAADAGLLAQALGAAGVGVLATVGGAAAGRRDLLRAVTLASAALLLGMVVGGFRGNAATPASGPNSVANLAPDSTWRVFGVVTDDPAPRGDALDLVLEDLRLDDRPLTGRLLVRAPRAVAAVAGDEVALEVSIRPPDPADPEESGYRERLRRQGILALGRSFEVTVVGHQSALLPDAFAGLRRWLLDGLVSSVPEPEASLGAGILLGVRAGIDPGVRDAFAVAGLSHVVAISGWNVAIVVAIISALTRPIRRGAGPVLPGLLAAGAIAAYVVLVGASPAVVRAALMAGALLIGRLGGSPAHAASALMAAVLLMILVAPAALWDVGFQLSALATGGLIVLAAPIEARLGRWPAWVRVPVALTVAAQLATLPVLLATFEQVSLVAPLANVAVVPLVPMVMAGSALAAMVGGLAAALPVPVVADAAVWLAGGTAWLPLRGLIAAGTLAAAVPFAALPLSGGPWLAVAWYPLLGLVARRINRRSDGDHPVAVPVKVAARDGLPHLALPESAALATSLAWLARPRVAVVGLVLTLGLTTAMSGPDGRLHLTVLDIGQGDAILVETPGGGITLIDGGVDPDLTLRRIGSAIPFHRRALAMVVLTHPHQDHLGGLAEVLRRYRVDLFMEGGRPVETAPHRALIAAARAEPGGRVVAAQAGQVIPLGGGAELEVVFPSTEDVARPLPDGDVNNASIVMLLRYGEFRALLTGDAESPVEALLAARGELGPIDVLKVGHHGSDSGTTAAFVAALRPRVAIISAGIDNEYGHPHGSTLANLTDVPDIHVYRTDRDGNVEVVTDGRTLQVVTDRLPAAPAGRIGPWPLPTATLPANCWPMVTGDRHDPPRPRRRCVPHRRGGGRVRRPGGRQRSGCPGTRANARRTTHRAGRA